MDEQKDIFFHMLKQEQQNNSEFRLVVKEKLCFLEIISMLDILKNWFYVFIIY